MMGKKRRLILAGRLIAVLAVMLFLPVMLNAGDLNPPGAPAPTMKTLDQIPPTWSQKLTSNRFVEVLPVVFPLGSFAAVLDKETGLVWEKVPSSNVFNMDAALERCIKLNKGGRKGWHVPTVEQLASIVDTTQSSPALPNGHPFTVDASGYYWSSTTYSAETTRGWALDMSNGDIYNGYKTWEKKVWCVRGGQSHDTY